MRFAVKRHGLSIVPDSDIDVAYLEEVLKLRKHGDTCLLVRSNTVGTSCIGSLRTADLPEFYNTELAEKAAKICHHQLKNIDQDGYDTKGKILSAMQCCIIDGAYEKLLALTMLMIRSYENDKKA